MSAVSRMGIRPAAPRGRGCRAPRRSPRTSVKPAPARKARVLVSPWAIPAALAGALCFAFAAAAQQHEAARAPAAAPPGPRLLIYLLMRPLWLAGLAAIAAGATLHVSALRLGPLAIVQPIGVTELLFALPLGAALHARRIERGDLLAAALVVAGLAGLLTSLQVQSGAPSISERSTILLAAATGAVALLAAVLGRRLGARGRAVALASGAGVAFGVTSALVRVIAHRVEVAGAETALLGLSSIVLLVTAVLGLLLAQSAYQAGSLGATLSTLTVVDPLVAIVVGELLLGEPVLFTPLGASTAAASAACIAAGMARLASRHGRQHEPDPPSQTQRGPRPSKKRSTVCAS